LAAAQLAFCGLFSKEPRVDEGLTMKYRDYIIERNKLGWTVRREDGELVGSQPSKEFARHMIDRIIRERSDWPDRRNV
jgi:hypothetical protein